MPDELEILKAACFPGCKFVDIGAHHGQFAAVMIVRGASVYCAEPHPTNAEVLRRNCKDAKVSQCAIDGSDGMANLYVGCPSTLFSLEQSWLPKWFPQFNTFAAPIKVTTRTWAQFCAEHQLTHVDICKVDTEGHDHVVLRSIIDGGIIPDWLCIETGMDNRQEIETLARSVRYQKKHEIPIDGSRGFWNLIYYRQRDAS